MLSLGARKSPPMAIVFLFQMIDALRPRVVWSQETMCLWPTRQSFPVHNSLDGISPMQVSAASRCKVHGWPKGSLSSSR